MLAREQAYKDYLDKYRDEIDNMMHKANKEHRTYINLSKDVPKEIMNELKRSGYTIKPFLPEPFEIPKPLGGKEKIQLPETYKVSWDSDNHE